MTRSIYPRHLTRAVVAVALVGTMAGPAHANTSGRAAEPARLRFCSDIGFAPMEFIKDGKPTGADIEIGRAIAKRLHKRAAWVNTSFAPLGPRSGITGQLNARRCDAIITSMTDNAERRKLITFVDYLSVGQSFEVQKGNPLGISTAADLAGKRVVVQAGVNNTDSLREVDRQNQAAGLAPMRITALTGTTGETTQKALEIMLAGEADVNFLDTVAAAYEVKQHDTQIELAGKPINTEPYGIGVRKTDKAFARTLKRVVKGLYRDCTMLRILRRWGIEAVALSGPSKVIIQSRATHTRKAS